jgi:hypothetical protein
MFEQDMGSVLSTETHLFMRKPAAPCTRFI